MSTWPYGGAGRAGAGGVEGVRLSLLKLRLGMIGVFAAITAIATLALVAVLTWLDLPFFGLYGILGFVLFMHVLQWMIGPYIINAIYHVRPLSEDEAPWLHSALTELSARSGIARPRLMVAEIGIPNAFAYGSPLTGGMVAVTDGLLQSLPREEVKAVLSHELGHLKHRDVLIMMMISIIPALVYYLGHLLYTSGWLGGYGGYGSSGGRRGNGGALLLLIGIGLMALSFVLNLFVYYMSRLREYFADSHAALTVEGGARNLQRALVRIMVASGRLRGEGTKLSEFKMFFIADPERAVEAYYVRDIDSLVERVKMQKDSAILELFSTHPSPSKRLRHLDRFIA